MTVRHAAKRAAVAAASSSPSTSSASSAAATAATATAAAKPESASKLTAKDVKLARSLIRAAIHGHAPHWKKMGWKAQYSKGGLDDPDSHPSAYLTKEVLEYDPTARQKRGGGWEKAPEGVERRQFRNLSLRDISKKYGLPTTGSGTLGDKGSKPKYFSTYSRLRRDEKIVDMSEENAGMEEDEDDHLPNDDLHYATQHSKARDDIPATAPKASTSTSHDAPRSHRNLKIGDFVQVRQGATAKTSIYLGENPHTLPGTPRRALLHGHGNALAICRYEDILFRMPGAVSEETARKATAMLQLSPAEYTDGLQEQDDARSAKSRHQATPAKASEATEEENLANPVRMAAQGEEEEELLWEKLGLEFQSPAWQDAFNAKLACGKALREADREQELAKREILTKGAKSLWKTMRAMHSGEKDEDVFITTQDAYEALYDDAAESAPSEIGSRKGKERAKPVDSDFAFASRKAHRMLALHNFLFLESEQFIADPLDFLSTHQFRLRSQAELENLYTVRAWIREEARTARASTSSTSSPKSNQEIVARFRERVQEVLKAGRSGKHKRWSIEEREIIRFLVYSLDMKRNLQTNPFQASAAVLVKSIRLDKESYPQGLDEEKNLIPEAFLFRHSVVELLKAIGVFKDWENLTARSRELHLAAWTKELSDSSALSPTSASPPNKPVLDAHDSQRHDFGSLPVYTVDDISASELDDGISIAPVEHSEPPAYWLHMHIADPTSSLSPNDTLALQAQKRQSSVYFPEMTWPMIPFDTIREQGWSLGDKANRDGPQGGQKVLTFSAKVDESGDVLEKLIRPAWVRNVRTTTYEKVDELLGAGRANATSTSSESDRVISWPGSSNTVDNRKSSDLPVRELKDLSPSAVEDLSNLRKIAAALLRKRVATSAIQWNTSSERSRGLVLSPRPLLPNFDVPSGPLPADEITPQIDLYLAPSHRDLTTSSIAAQPEEKGVESSPAQMIVSECMILAGRLAGAHLSSYTGRVAVPYRGQMAPISRDPQALQDLMDSRSPSTGEVDPAEVFKRNISFQPAYFSTEPVGHWPMGISGGFGGGYLRATSPLRRYSDLLVHWQLKSTLFKGGDARPPFTVEDVQGMITSMENTTRLRTRMERRARLFWRLYLISRKLEQIRADPSADPAAAELLLGSQGLTAIIGDTRRDTRSHRNLSFVKLAELDGLAATMLSDPSKLYHGSVKVKIEGIVLDEYSKLFVRPIEEGAS